MRDLALRCRPLSRVIMTVVGLLLLIAAGTKIHAMLLEGDASTFTPLPGLMWSGWIAHFANVSVVAWEMVLGVWLIAAFRSRLAWGLALGTFAVFTVVTVSAIAIDRDSCGCLGAVPISPWFTLIVDLIVLVGLVVGRPKRETAVSKPQSLQILGTIGVAGLGVPLLTVAALHITLTRFPQSALAQAIDVPADSTTETGSAEPQDADERREGVVADIFSGQVDYSFGYVESGKSYSVTIVLSNPSASAIGIHDIEIECACTQLLNPPSVLSPEADLKPTGDSPEAGYPLTIRFKPPGFEGSYRKQIVLKTEHPELPAIALNLAARINRPLAVQPRVADLEPQDEGRPWVGRVEVHNDGTAPVRLLYATSDTPGLFAVTPREPVPAAGQAEIEIRLAGDAEPGAGRLQVVTDSSPQKTLSIEVRW